MMKNRKSNGAASGRAKHQHGVVLLFCLVILAILLAGGVAILRSMNASMFSAGNLAFKRDLVNQGEQAVSTVLRAFTSTGGLGSALQTAASQPQLNYSAIELQTNDRGIPRLLLQRSATPSGVDVAGNTFTPGIVEVDGRDGVKIRYVIDRLCNATGTFATLGKTRCTFSPTAASQVTGGTAGEERPPVPPPAMYRLSVRVDGPRDTQVFLQTSFSKPE